mgnify:CR=1 FL=1
MSCMGLYSVGTIVLLNDGQTAIVTSTTEKTKLRPMVLMVKDRDGKFYKQRKIYNLSSQQWNNPNDRLEVSSVLEPGDSDIKVSKVLEEESLTLKSNISANIDDIKDLLK